MFLERCLTSVSGVVDEIVIVDTGSTDSTEGIAKKFTDKIVHTPWQNDFAQARNAGLELAIGKWILFLDADEQLDPESRDELRMWATHDEYEGFFLIFHNHSDDGMSDTINPILRMFKNNVNYRFKGRIHEQIAGTITSFNPNARFHTTNVKIHHYGYQSEIVSSRDKLNRNMTLLKMVLDETPNDAFVLYNLGIEYLRNQDVQAAFEAFQKARVLANPAISYSHLLYKYESYCLTSLGRVDDALALLAKGKSIYPQYTDFYHLEGIWLASQGRLEEAKQSLLQALRIGPPRTFFHSQEGCGGYQSLYELGVVYEKLHDYAASIRCYIEANRLRPKWNAPLYRVLWLLRCTCPEKDMPDLIEQLFRMSSAQAVLRMIRMCLDTGCYFAACTLLDELDNEVEDSEKWRLEVQCCLCRGDVIEAHALLQTCHLGEGEMQNSTEPSSQQLRTCVEWLYQAIYYDGPVNHLIVESDQLALVTKAAFAVRYELGLTLLTALIRQLNQQDQTSDRLLHTFTHTIASRVDHHLAQISELDPMRRLLGTMIRLDLPRMYEARNDV